MLIERQSQALFCWYGCFVLFCFLLPLLWLLLQHPPSGTKEPFCTGQWRPIGSWHGPSLHWPGWTPWGGGCSPHRKTHRKDWGKGLGLPCWGFSFEGNFWFGLFLNLLYRKLHGGSVGRRERNPWRLSPCVEEARASWFLCNPSLPGCIWQDAYLVLQADRQLLAA